MGQKSITQVLSAILRGLQSNPATTEKHKESMTRVFSQINSAKILEDRCPWRVATLAICIHPGRGTFIGPILPSVSAVTSITNLGCGAEKGNGDNGVCNFKEE